MPKKLQTNPKAVEANERKANVKKEKQEKENKAKEDAKWVETDKHILQKEDRKKAAEDKKHAEAERKKQAREALEREDQDLKKQYSKNLPTPKVTQAEIARRKEIEDLAAKRREAQEKEQEKMIQENMNRVIALERAQHGENYIEARTLGDAADQLSIQTGTNDKVEKKPKVTYAMFEEKNLAEARAENPTLKLSQVKELLWKQWQKSAENPLNQSQ